MNTHISMCVEYNHAASWHSIYPSHTVCDTEFQRQSFTEKDEMLSAYVNSSTAATFEVF